MACFRVIDLAGQPFDLGLAHGRALAREIQDNFATYRDLIRGYAGLEEKRILELASLFKPLLAKEAPHLLEEMEGLAKGAGVSLETILAINVRTELVYPDQLAGECTSIGLSGARTADGRPLLAQNWDWKPEIRARAALFRIKPSQGPGILTFCEAGQVAKIGFNEHGLGVAMNILFTGGVQIGLPVHVLLRLVLERAADVAQARDLVLQARRASSSHFLLADAGGAILGIETTPETVGQIQPANGAVVHTNHFCDPALAQRDMGLALIPDSPVRLERIRELIAGRDKWDAGGLKEILADHQSGPPSICRHVNPADPAHAQMATLGSFIFDLSRLKAQVACGQPCQNEYQEVKL